MYCNIKKVIFSLTALSASTLFTLSLYGAPSGSVYTTNATATVVNQNIYNAGTDVYISGGPQNTSSAGLTDGTYYFQVTDPSGKTLLSTDNAVCRQLTVAGGRVTGASAASGSCAHANGTLNPANGVTPVQLAPFSVTPNNGGEYKVDVVPAGSATVSTTNPLVLNFSKSSAKSDNFKVLASSTPPPPPTGSCQGTSSLSVLVTGTNVTSYVPKGNWSVTPVKGISVVNVEGTSVTPTNIPTANVVNSCASNSTTGQTVCTANNTDIYLLSGTSLSSTLTSGGSGSLFFSGGAATNIGVAMDAIHNQAVIGLSIGGGTPGFQFLDLGTSTLETPFASAAGRISEDPLLDPTRSLLLSATESDDFEIINVATSTSPLFFENSSIPASGELDSTAEECTTGIAIAPAEGGVPSNLFIADLTQATFTPGTPGTWTAPSQVQTLSESFLSAGASGSAIAQGTHTGILSGEFGGDGITAITLPSTSGSGTPAISDWVSCNIGNGFSDGFDPHTLTAYQSPTSGHAIALLANAGASELAVVDLTAMLNTTTVPRSVGGHACVGPLPSSVLSFIPVP